MVTGNHYGDEELVRLLRSFEVGEFDAVFNHVECCEACQTQLEAISQEGMSWAEVSELLRPDLRTSCDSAETTIGVDCDSSTDSAARFLESSEHPGSLGRFSRFEILEILGRGGMGIVLRGFDTSLNRHSAVKVLSPELACSAAARRRFSREARSAAAVVHPHVVPIQTVDEHGGLPYLVMPVVEGRSVDARVTNSGPLANIEAVRIAAQVAGGLAAAHEQGLVHRDIKPANILLENGVERVQITDFGLARAIDDASMTRSGVISGTPQYMSPEQAHGDAIDHRSDLFSLGSLMYFMLTGRSPFRAETTMGVLNRIGNDEPRSIRTINEEVPLWLEQVIFKLLEKRAADRFQTANEVVEVLDRCLAHLQQPSVVPEPQSAFIDVQRSECTSSWRGKAAALAVLFGVFAATALIVIEFGKGTIHVQTNSEEDVPVRILQGDTVVDQLVVTQSGVTTRLRAGKYTIEVDGDATGHRIQGDRIVLERGKTWLATVVVRQEDSDFGEDHLKGAGGTMDPRDSDIASETRLGSVGTSIREEQKKAKSKVTGLASNQRVHWRAALGSQTMRSPVVSGDHIFVGTNNAQGYLPRYPSGVDLGVLLCFQKSDGRFLWQHSNEKLPTGRVHDWPMQGICSRPCVEGDRLWYVTNRCEIVCLDTNGFRDGENDGQIQDESSEDLNEADVVWRLNMLSELGVRPHNISTCTVALWKDRIFAVTGNGVGGSHVPPLAVAPSFIAVDKTSGRVLWRDDSPGQNVLHGQWGSPLVLEVEGRPQVVFPGGDGWLYSFRPEGTSSGRGDLIWKFDCNPKESKWELGGKGARNNLLHEPTLHDGLLYVATGQDPEHGEGPGRLWCIDPTGTGDVSSELVRSRENPVLSIPHRRVQACVKENGEFTVPNPNSKAVWYFDQADVDGNGKIDMEEQLSRSLSTIAIRDDLLFLTDIRGILHCLDRRTGQQHWGYDTFAAVYSSPVILDDRVYIGTEDGETHVLACSADPHVAMPNGLPLQTFSCESSVYASTVEDNGILFITSSHELVAIGTDVGGR